MQMNISEIKEKMKPGDLESAANIVGISANNASQVLKRTNSKHHDKLKNILEKVINMRELVLNELR